MIGYLTGTVTHLYPDDSSLILTVSGVGYLVYVTTSTLSGSTIGDTRELYTHLVVRETALDLYGFETLDEQHFFELLISISGVGPKSALAILSLADVATLHSAIAENNTDYLTKVSGIGKKIAQKIILELKDKLGGITTGTSGATNTDDPAVIEALEAMGYTTTQAREAVKQLPADTTGLNARVAAALKLLA